MKNTSVRLRRPTIDDIGSIEELAKKYDFPLVERFETAAIVDMGSEAVAFAVTRSILELVLYCDGRDRDKVIAINRLMEQAKLDAKHLGYNQLFAFIDDEGFSKSLIKHYGFRVAKGIPVILDLGS